jgi:hypothetical protein
MQPLLLTMVLVGCVGIACPHDATAGDARPEHVASATGKQAPITRRWVADASLHTGMLRVRKAAAALEHLEHGHLDAGQVRALADEIRAAVNFMFANCRLDPEPDAALHPLLARLLAASNALRDKPTDAAPLAELRAVLARYPQVFEDSDWPASGQ